MAAFAALEANDPARVAASEQRHGLPYAAIAANKARVVAHALDLAETVLSCG
jgi:hypothetical protein